VKRRLIIGGIRLTNTLGETFTPSGRVTALIGWDDEFFVGQRKGGSYLIVGHGEAENL